MSEIKCFQTHLLTQYPYLCACGVELNNRSKKYNHNCKMFPTNRPKSPASASSTEPLTKKVRINETALVATVKAEAKEEPEDEDDETVAEKFLSQNLAQFMEVVTSEQLKTDSLKNLIEVQVRVLKIDDQQKAIIKRLCEERNALLSAPMKTYREEAKLFLDKSSKEEIEFHGSLKPFSIEALNKLHGDMSARVEAITQEITRKTNAPAGKVYATLAEVFKVQVSASQSWD